jgi:hypothetical protein
VASFVFRSSLSDRNRAILSMKIVQGICKTFLTFSGGNSHNKRCVLLVITIENVSTIVDVRNRGWVKILDQLAYPYQLE